MQRGVSPFLSTLANTDSTPVPRWGVVAGPLAYFKSYTTAAAALAPWRPGGPATIPEEQSLWGSTLINRVFNISSF